MGKKPKHRVRHVPPGPCGIWFQAVQAKKKQRRSSTNTDGSIGNYHGQLQEQHQPPPPPFTAATGEGSHNEGYELTQQHAYSQDGKSLEKSDQLEDTLSAWQAMQTETNVTTPYNPTPWATTILDPEERYQIVRNNIPDHYVTLWEILRGDVDMKMAPQQRLRVLVHAVEMSNHHNIWTVDLRDDTGASIKAWMEPRFIQDQLRNSMMDDNEMSMIRPGLVWMLKDVSLMIVHSSSLTGSSNTMSQERLQRMLLISGQNIEKIWYPIGKSEENDFENHQHQQPNGRINNAGCLSNVIDSSYPPEDTVILHQQQVNDDAIGNNHTNRGTIEANPNQSPERYSQQKQQRTQQDVPANTVDILSHTNQHASQTLTMDTAIIYESQQPESQVGDLSQSIKTTAHYTGASLNTQETLDRQKVHTTTSQKESSTQPSQQRPVETGRSSKPSRTPKKRQRENHHQESTPVPNKTPPRCPASRSTQTRSPNRSPRKVFSSGGLWDTPNEFLLEMIQQDEQRQSRSSEEASVQSDEDSESSSQSGTSFERGKLFDPSSWTTGVGMDALDEYSAIE
ncbi:hypothetical protein IV203_013397 [Nitzschia inconspicua]|uniref:Uncharacterized protein n=1 Tax=Nitzschia inconspicua TaxID=303405 RepID=A0A9K3M5H7_9STRA|nr:hypothetical protein IV203_013397 [Nitzschia inconspicua]